MEIEKKMDSSLLSIIKWQHNICKKMLVKIIERFGIPNVFAPQPGGLAIWTEDALKGTIFSKVEVRDELREVTRNVDARWTCLLLSVNYDLDLDMIEKILKIDDSVVVDKISKTITVRSYDFESATAILMVIIGVANKSSQLGIDSSKRAIRDALNSVHTNVNSLPMFSKQIAIYLKHSTTSPLINEYCDTANAQTNCIVRHIA